MKAHLKGGLPHTILGGWAGLGWVALGWAGLGWAGMLHVAMAAGTTHPGTASERAGATG